MKQPGDLFTLGGIGEFDDGVECIVMEVSSEDGRITKAKAAVPDERLLKSGFFLEGEDYVVFEFDIITKN